MDSLLERLRRDMADLSVQGDDFTRQIWRMYGTFEQMLAHHDQTGGRLTLNLFPEMRMNYVETLPAFNAWTHSADPTGPVNVNASYGLGLGSSEEYLDDDLGLDLTVRPRMPSMSGNPLLETISAIEDSSESDECEYLHGGPGNHVVVNSLGGGGSGSYPSCVGGAAHGQQSVTARSADFLLSSHAPLNLQGDKEFSGYAGSNSIDSGYKSSCPTPELSDYHPAGHDGKRGSIASVGSAASLHYASQPANKLRIAMGTRVMATAAAAPPLPSAGVANPSRLATLTTMSSSGAALPGSSGLVDPNSIDHLLSLRESLMTAIQRYETAVQRRAVSAANIAMPEMDDSPVHRPQASPRASRHRSRSPTQHRPRSLSASSSTANATQRRSSPAMYRKRHNRPGSPLVGGESGEARRDSPSRRLSKAGLPVAANSSPPGLPARTYGALHLHHNPPHQQQQQQPVLPQRAPRISDEGIAALLSVAALKLQATHANQERSGSFSHPPQLAGQPGSHEDSLEKQATRGDARGLVWPGNNKMKMEPGGENAAAAAFMLEGEIDTLLYGQSRQRGAGEKPNKVSSVSQLREQVQKMAQQACSLTDQPEDVRSRFSRVARCMLDIIEDLHKQSLNERIATDGHLRSGLHGNNDHTSNKPAPAPLLGNGSGQRSTLSRPQPKRTSGGGSGSKLNAQASQQPQQQVQLRLDSACPANLNKRLTEEPLLPDYMGSTNNSSSHSHGGSNSETLLAGADYHVYEEILYDWTSSPQSTSSPPSLPPSQQLHHEEVSQQPPPLPSRPATLAKPKFDFDKFLIRPYSSSHDRPERAKDESQLPATKKVPTPASQPSTTTQSSRSLWDQLMGTKLMHGCGTGTKISNLSRPPSSKPKGNVYTMFHDRERKPTTSHLEHEPNKELPKEVIEDEYGFRIVTHLV